MAERQPFTKSLIRRQAAEIEFHAFKEVARASLLEACKGTKGFDELDKAYRFRIETATDDTFQAGFVRRLMGRLNLEGKTAWEYGAHLLYSRGPSGDIVVTLYPCKSTLATVAEDQVFIGIGNFSAYQLQKRLKKDARALVGYCYVTSVDAEATWREWLRVKWIRTSKPQIVDGKFVAGDTTLVQSSLKAAYRAALLGAFTAVMRPLGVVAVAALLVWFKWPGMLKYVQPGSAPEAHTLKSAFPPNQ